MKKMRFVFCYFMTIVFMMSVAFAEEELFWRKVRSDGTVIVDNRYTEYYDKNVFSLLRDGEDWYIKYRTGAAVMLTDMELQYQYDYT